ncbi:MAG: hypothetical protein CFH23_00177 [Alphaproteobacteria bacterium MarineAlpha6_Bin1]|jgi:secondary thiamine-phosphate synthase enzyme|nr:MAG: hypothetical protein CFH23_00177 [Alphaproteobacteria bacterium MarineAlpha6_Bin1]|tara:strand:+ start:859 stop:1272 length:414 start_codon:yes stop_codon:yes gene_type:complete
MEQYIETISLATKGQGLYEITSKISEWLSKQKIKKGLLTIFLQHTSCSLIIQENADPDVKKDLKKFFDQIAPESNNYIHQSEGPDDMPAHIKSSLMQTHLSIPIENNQMVLGTWQGVYIFEHRNKSHNRKIKLHCIG